MEKQEWLKNEGGTPFYVCNAHVEKHLKVKRRKPR